MKNEDITRLVLSLQDIFAKHEITHIDLAHMVSSYCEDFLEEESDIEPETVEKYTNLQIDLWDVLTALVDESK
ncbi:hypothetical protein [Bacillus wiedmannii]|uniref:hypothetical protein n=1 Tax=Bacillus wiedmannii TaxID=1890302 RepID=UPI002E1A0FDE|nr:hypothetical protein [Bacillus wiedmannii]